MSFFRNPVWLSPFEFPYRKFEEIPQTVFDKINADLDRLILPQPEVSVVIIAWNESVNVLKTVASLAQSETKIPFEILVVNNNSTDDTGSILEKLHIRSPLQTIQGCGPARQMGLEEARGKFILTGDADVLYPPLWIEKMTEKLRQPGVVCVYGRYSFMADEKVPRWQLSIFEWLKDRKAGLQALKRPHLNALGMTMGYRREAALQVGYVMKHIRGEDGRLVFDLMQNGLGKVVEVKSSQARVWTGTRTLERDGNFVQAIFNRIAKQISNLSSFFSRQAPHDTKTSEN
jgi:glycosyltransferase involved in cell wall biosynthesis